MVHIQIHTPELPKDKVGPFAIKPADSAHFVATFNRALRLSDSDNVAACDVYVGERTEDRYINGMLATAGGWLEHTIVVTYHAPPGLRARTLTIGAIQRSIGVASEFHS